MSDAYLQGSADAPEAIRILWREHSNILLVLNRFEELVSEAAGPLDLERVRAILDYMEGFADTLHHPKEEHYLMPALVRRKPDLALLVQKVQEEHDQGAAAMTELRHSFEACARDPEAATHFRALAKDYVEFQKRHMTREDWGLLPVALEILSDEDMAELTLAFTRPDDPLIGVAHQTEFQRLFDAIVSDTVPEAAEEK